MQNPFVPGEKVITMFKGAEVEATVAQIFQREVQVKTQDEVLRWRTMHTVWYPGQSPIPKLPRPGQSVPPQPVRSPEPVVSPAIAAPTIPSEPIQPVADPVEPSVVSAPGEVLSTEAIQSEGEELAIVSPAVVGLTSCGTEEAEELRRIRSKGRKKRKAKR